MKLPDKQFGGEFEINQPVVPGSLPEYWLACHFKNRPLFIQQYLGKINTKELHREFGEWVMFAKSNTTHGPSKTGELFPNGYHFFIRLCDRSFAKITAYHIEVYAESFKLAVRRLNSLVKEFSAVKKSEQPHFHLISFDRISGSMETTQVTLPNKGFMDDSELNLHYGEDFSGWHKELVKKFNSKNYGVSIFRGAPGTGKTT